MAAEIAFVVDEPLQPLSGSELGELLQRKEHLVRMQCPLAKPGYVGVTSEELKRLVAEVLDLRDKTFRALQARKEV